MTFTIEDLLTIIQHQDERITAQDEQYAALTQRFTTLEQLIDDMKPAKMLPEMRTLTPNDLQRIVKLRADLFHNLEAKQGEDKWKLKLFVWFETKTAKQGHIRPLMFPMRVFPYFKDVALTDGSLFATLAIKLDDGEMAGHLVHKKPGTVYHKDHVIIKRGDVLTFHVGSWSIRLHDFRKLKSDKESAPVGTWYWKQEDSE